MFSSGLSVNLLHVASMGPRSEDCGYVGNAWAAIVAAVPASMGPRSEDCGYEITYSLLSFPGTSFNGSTVRGLWLWKLLVSWLW